MPDRASSWPGEGGSWDGIAWALEAPKYAPEGPGSALSILVPQDSFESCERSLPCADLRTCVRAHGPELEESVLPWKWPNGITASDPSEPVRPCTGDGAGLLCVDADSASDESILWYEGLILLSILLSFHDGSGPGDAALASSASGDGSPEGTQSVVGDCKIAEVILDLIGPESGDAVPDLRCTSFWEASSGISFDEGNSSLSYGFGLSSSDRGTPPNS